MSDRFDLDRFVSAQRDSYGRALREVREGAKRSHWMWFVFPQLTGLGRSAMAQLYAISGLTEAKAYLAHPVLGHRLREITAALDDIDPPYATRVFGGIDALKLGSSLTLFAYADDEDGAGLFHRTLDRWFDGQEDAATVERL